MIDAEEIFDSAFETGYRLCSRTRPQMEDMKLFSTFWDPCNENRLYLTSQDGILKTIDVSTGKSNTYNVLFKLFSASTSTVKTEELYKISGRDNSGSTTGTVMTRHFDKMVCIPGRPDEFIFLLGVSQTLFYTALPGAMPYPDEPFISGTSRADMGEYIFGTPIMEIDKHDSRVTSLAVSTSGQVLASGDEHGMIRLLLLRQLDMFNIRPNVKYKANEPVDTIKHHSIPTLPKKGRAAFRAHLGGPVFALQWLNFAIGPNSNRSYVLCSGSVDKVVRIWHVNATSQGLGVSQLFHFDIQSAHILCLSSYYLDTSPLSPFEAAKTGGSILVSAGTNNGTVYLWNIPVNELFALVEADPICHHEKAAVMTSVIGEHMVSTDEAVSKYGVLDHDVLGKSERKAKMATFEHALWIHSLLHTSTNPIYTLCMTTYSHPAGRYLILLSADICGTVHVHKSDDTEILTVRNDVPGITGEAEGEINFASSRALKLAPKTVQATRDSELLTMSISQLDAQTNQTSAFKLIEHCPLSYYGENAYPHQVVSITNQYTDHGVKGLNTVFRDFALYSRALFSTSVHMQQQNEELSRLNMYQPTTTDRFMVNNNTVNPMEIVSPKRLARKVPPKASESARVLICLANCDIIEYTSKDLFEDLSANVVHEKVTSERSPRPSSSSMGQRSSISETAGDRAFSPPATPQLQLPPTVKSAFTFSPADMKPKPNSNIVIKPKSGISSLFGPASPKDDTDNADGNSNNKDNNNDLDHLPPPPPPPIHTLPVTAPAPPRLSTTCTAVPASAPLPVTARRANFQTVKAANIAVNDDSDDQSSIEPTPQQPLRLPPPINTSSTVSAVVAPAPRGRLSVSPVPASNTAANTLANTTANATVAASPPARSGSGGKAVSPGGHQYLTSFKIDESKGGNNIRGDGSPRPPLQRIDSMRSATTATSGTSVTSYGTSVADSDEQEDWKDLQKQVDTAVNSVLQSELSVQNLQSVKSLYIKHEELVQQRDALSDKDTDDMTVTTTDSDRQYAAAVVNRLMTKKHNEFMLMTKKSVEGQQQQLYTVSEAQAEKERAARLKKKLPKQVDTTWLQRKHQLIPSSEDLSILTSPEPLIAFVCDIEKPLRPTCGKFDTIIGNKATKANDNPFRLHSSIKNDHILPTYSMHIDSADVFGSIHTAQLDYSDTVLKQQQLQPQSVNSFSCSGSVGHFDTGNSTGGGGRQWDDSFHENFHDRYDDAASTFF